MTLSQAKNAMRRAIDDLIDPPSTKQEKQRVWEYFNSRCAYCGRSIERSSRYGHIDHLISRANGGSNNIGNCVLACKECNGNEKRDQPWKDFLRLKCADNSTFEMRLKKIESWQTQPATRKPVTLSSEAKATKSEVEAVIAVFEKKFGKLREKVRL
jgi:CRISPR/Cas system Type II protein with McrA/HNH and RuvC-like nuclease domain